MKHILGNFRALKYMNGLVLMMNNEEAYGEWIWIVPDEASDDDLLQIAEDEESFKEVEQEFFRIAKIYGEDGLYIGK